MFGLLLFSPLHNFISVISVKFLCKSYGGHAALRTTYPYGPGECWEQFRCCTKRCNLINHQDTFLSSLTRAPELSKGPAQQKQKASRGRNSCIRQARRICLFWETTGEMTVQWCWKENYQREIHLSDSMSFFMLSTEEEQESSHA